METYSICRIVSNSEYVEGLALRYILILIEITIIYV